MNTEAFTFIGVALGVAVTSGGVLAVVYVYFRRNVTQLVRDENQDQRHRIDTLSEAEKRCQQELRQERDDRLAAEAAWAERMAKAEGTMQTLSDMVTGASAVSELTTVVSFNHDEVLKRLDSLDRRLARRRT